MNELITLGLIVLAGFGVFILAWWAERSTRRPGLAAFIAGFLALIGAAIGIAAGRRLLPALFVIQAIGFFYHARWKRSASRH